MVIDILFLLFIAVGFYRGFKNGIIYSVFSLVGFFLGIILALKFSYIVINLLHGSVHTSAKTLAILSFLLVFLLVAGLFLLLAWGLEKILQTFLLNLPNKIIGGLIYALIGLYLLCVFIWFEKRFDLIPESQKKSSLVYSHINELAPQVVDVTGKALPFVKDAFSNFDSLFGKN